uniref:Uncharacterized protein n=1 Tax=Micromonas pusilla TaxID=38833 RepID=A0A6U0PM80_MICPS|mmetsp:Transcript_3975/g.16192  ORF Transcript_3975/g.16192 Transcript_3975/m.16192 type:complete len:112 (+) Transcript_3975:82-417(+)
MSWIWEKYPTWRLIVLGTRDSRPAMGIFSLTTMVFLPLVAGTTFMSITNGEEGSMFTKQRGVADGHAKLMTDVNNRHLRQLLLELQDRRGGEERWRKALEGRTIEKLSNED